jgi:hypothetical protein
MGRDGVGGPKQKVLSLISSFVRLFGSLARFVIRTDANIEHQTSEIRKLKPKPKDGCFGFFFVSLKSAWF